jgi:putative copper export protein
MQAAIVLARGLHLAGMLSFLGAAAFRTLILPAAAGVPAPLRVRLDRLAWIGLAVAVAAGTGWLTIEAASMADAVTPLDALQALPLVTSATRFGQVMAARLGLLLLAGLVLAWSGRGAPAIRQPAQWALLAVSVAAVAMQGLMAHAGAAEGDDRLLVSEALHLPAAGIWFGALLPLFLSIAWLAPDDGAAVCERFTPIGLACVLVIAATGAIQAAGLVGSLPRLVGTPYGRIVLLKIGLFIVALALALLNRLWLTDRLAIQGLVRGLRLSVAVEALVGCAIVLAAAWLASGIPAIDAQPVWPPRW